MQAVITHLADFFKLVGALCAGYLINGWPFVLAHLFVGYLIRNSWKELNREKEALKDWHITITKDTDPYGVRPAPSARRADERSASDSSWQIRDPLAQEIGKKRETIVVLEQFVQESRELGGRGFFVPITDFSDRLDSAVEGKIAELHDRTNLFLFVGIAGTMFGVFEFASSSYTLMISGAAQSEKIIKLGEYLSRSMSKAFPVGFFGLLFTFVAQILATRPEQRLREELSEATRKALETREATTYSQAELIQNAAAAIATAMQPLKDLKDTLSESLKPVVEVFGERLDKSLGLLEAQFKRLEQTSGGLESAVLDVRTAVGFVAEATKSLDSSIKETPKVINRLLELEKQHKLSLDKIDSLFVRHFDQADQLTKNLKVAVEALSVLSDRVVEETLAGIKRIENASVSGWTTAADTLRNKLEADLASLFEDAGLRMSAVTITVENALHVMKSVGAVSAGSIAAIAKVAPKIAESYQESLIKVEKDSIALWGKMIEDLGRNTQPQYLAFLDAVQKGTSKSSDALAKAAEEWSDLARNSKVILKEPVEAAVSEARKDLVESLRTLDTNVEDRIKEFSAELNNLQKSTGELVDKVSSINASLSNWAVDAAPLAKEIHGVTSSLPPLIKGMKDQHELQAAIVKTLHGTSEKLAKIANRATAATTKADPRDAGPKIFELREQRVWWKPNTWRKR